MSYSESQYPVVSVLIPVYNAETYIGRCLDSILSQDYPALEIVAIDDGSSDSSFSILEGYERRHPSVVRAYHQQNQGVAVTRNKAISLASGVYLMFADNDDYLEPDSIKLLVNKALEANADIVCAGFQRPDTHGTIVSRVIPSPETQWAPYKVSAAWAKLYRTDFIRENYLSFLSTNIGEDIYFTLPAQLLSTKTVILPQAVYNWFYNTESVSNTLHKTSNNLEFSRTLTELHSFLQMRSLPIEGLTLHYIVRLIVWFLFYTRKGDGSSQSMKSLDSCIHWLDEAIPDWRNDAFATPRKPTGDAIPNRIATWLFVQHEMLFRAMLRSFGRLL
ncbi:glycosyltransferase family 2 protein [Enorma burkinafasonensis]|uniref:glycosyltransferase family 2 protein n=1 Tax=Enorma burkinafasonensis TaxID=2590867 RepID=UPI0011AAA0CA|nr:glycosyltransferase [Enorma burkinafasonensis]